jgi:hypothetical protein
MPAALELRRPTNGDDATRDCRQTGGSVSGRFWAGEGCQRPAGRRAALPAQHVGGEKIRVSKSESIINNFKILKIKIKIQNVLCHRGCWIDRWAVMLPVAYSMYVTATNIFVGYMISVRHRCVCSRGVHTIRHG